MSFKLTKDELKQRDELVMRLNAAADKLQAVIQTFNDAVAVLGEPVGAAVEEYNGVVAEAEDFASTVASQADQDAADKSDRWLEGERGQAAVQFKDEWEAMMFEEVNIDLPDGIEANDLDHAATLEAGPEAAE